MTKNDRRACCFDDLQMPEKANAQAIPLNGYAGMFANRGALGSWKHGRFGVRVIDWPRPVTKKATCPTLP